MKRRLCWANHRLRIGQAPAGRRRPLGTEPLQEYGEHLGQLVQAPHIGPVAREMGKPVSPVVAGVIVDRPNFALLVQEPRQVDGDDFLVGEAQVGVRAKRWA